MRNMLIRPTEQELEDFGTPDFTIFNAGEFPGKEIGWHYLFFSNKKLKL
jgi:ATP-dependent phosphoenolpyruvate carboxykinase